MPNFYEPFGHVRLVSHSNAEIVGAIDRECSGTRLITGKPIDYIAGAIGMFCDYPDGHCGSS